MKSLQRTEDIENEMEILEMKNTVTELKERNKQKSQSTISTADRRGGRKNQ